jgi:hypothetical protein
MKRIFTGLFVSIVGVANIVPQGDFSSVFGFAALALGVILIVWSFASSKPEYNSGVAVARESLESVIQDSNNLNSAINNDKIAPYEDVGVDEVPKNESTEAKIDRLGDNIAGIIAGVIAIAIVIFIIAVVIDAATNDYPDYSPTQLDDPEIGGRGF